MYIVATMVETTDIRRNEIEREESKLQLDFTLDAAQIISWEYNAEDRIFYSPRSTGSKG